MLFFFLLDQIINNMVLSEQGALDRYVIGISLLSGFCQRMLKNKNKNKSICLTLS